MTERSPFTWPRGKRAAVSLTFDDARISQVDTGLPVLDRYGVKATFYLSPPNIEQRQPAWRSAAAHGHEMGNHTMTHPCTGNFPWSQANALEEKNIQDMEQEMESASNALRDMVGVLPITFAYPCGQKFVGRGLTLQSYVPLVAHRFLAGRGFRDETVNGPTFCDLAQLMGVDSDDQPFERLRPWLDRAIDERGWVVFCSHDIGNFPRQSMSVQTLESLCLYCSDVSKGIWMDSVARIASYIQNQC